MVLTAKVQSKPLLQETNQYKNKYEEFIMNKNIFWVFGTLQSLSLGMIVFLLFRALNIINGESVIGLDTQIVLSMFFPLFLLLVEYTLFTKK